MLDFYFDLNEKCNLNCVMCGNKRGNTEFTFEEFKEILPVFKKVDDFQFGCLYEPTLTPYFSEILFLLRDKLKSGVKGKLVTNGLLLNKNWLIHDIIWSDLFKIIYISVDGSTEKIYENIRKGSDFNKIVKNIKNLIKYRNCKGSKTEIHLIFTIQKQNVEDLPNFIKFSEKLGVDGVRFHKAIPFDNIVSKEYFNLLQNKIKECREISKWKLEFPEYNIEEKIVNNKRIECSYKKELVELRMDCYGLVWTNCLKTKLPLGNIKTESIEVILEKAKALFTYDAVCHGCYKSKEISELDIIIPPEIKNDEFYFEIAKLIKSEKIGTILEIGSSAGEGSTEAFVNNLKEDTKLFCMEVSIPRFEKLKERYKENKNIICYNASSIPIDKFPKEEDIVKFYVTTKTVLNNYPLRQVLRWLKQDKTYIKNNKIEENGIEKIKSKNNIKNFDLVLIDGSEFTGKEELNKVYGSKFILLDDINSYKNIHNYSKLLGDDNYKLIKENRKIRNGYAIFRKKEVKINKDLPLHIFTIVQNGEPFIEKHIEVFKKLPFKWVWHAVEGMAEIKHCGAWSKGKITEELHKNCLSNDGTTAYLNKLAKEYPENVIIYRKPYNTFWDGKIEMVSRPLANIKEESLLLQVDCDETWDREQLIKLRELFIEKPEKTSAWFKCEYLVGKNLVITSDDTYGNHTSYEWIRSWRYKPGDRWLTHEPPALYRNINNQWVDLAKVNPFTREETEKEDLIFVHEAYVYEHQLKFKELYYNYKNAVEEWKKLQNVEKFPVYLRDYFSWVKDNTIVDRRKLC
jgi:MoaA/NifB/PqqE/SkfB family radical SAM enzyme